MPKRTIIAREEQTVWDIAVQEFGSVEGVFKVLADNPALSGLDEPLTPGGPLTVRQAPLDPDVVRFFAGRPWKPVTGDLLDIVPPPGPTGGWVVVTTAASWTSTLDLSVRTSTGYLELVVSDGPPTVLGVGVPHVQITFPPVADSLMAFRSCNVAGAAEGTFTTLVVATDAAIALELAGLQGSSLHNLVIELTLASTITLPACAITQVYMEAMDNLASIDMHLVTGTEILWVYSCGALAQLSMPDGGIIHTASVEECALDIASVDGLFLELNHTLPGNLASTIGGTSASPSAASATKRSQLGVAGWMVLYN